MLLSPLSTQHPCTPPSACPLMKSYTALGIFADRFQNPTLSFPFCAPSGHTGGEAPGLPTLVQSEALHHAALAQSEALPMQLWLLRPFLDLLACLFWPPPTESLIILNNKSIHTFTNVCVWVSTSQPSFGRVWWMHVTSQGEDKNLPTFHIPHLESNHLLPQCCWYFY